MTSGKAMQIRLCFPPPIFGKYSYSIKLTDCGLKKIAVVHFLREKGCCYSLAEAMQMVDERPTVILTKTRLMTRREAEEEDPSFIKELEDPGATAEWYLR